MSAATLAAASRRIAEHAHGHGLGKVHIVFHGGEPLLAGPGRLESAIAALRDALPPGTDMGLSVQTNGVLLNERVLRVFAENKVGVGISLDGTAAANDRHRRRTDGRSSHGDVLRALQLLTSERYHTLFAGLLCTIDLANDPIATYEALARFDPPTIDFLLPLGNWSFPPVGIGGISGSKKTPYADWLLDLFDYWYSSPGAIPIRIFDEIVQLMLGGRPGTEIVGSGRVGFVVIETDGSIESADSLKSTYPGAAGTGMSVFSSALDDALGHPVVAAQQQGSAGLCDTCRVCPVVAVCGGGLYAHRYRAVNGFRNPSVYCADLFRIIDHIGRRVLADLDGLRGRP